MELTKDNTEKYEYTGNNTWKEMYNLTKQLIIVNNLKTNDNGLIKLLNNDYTKNESPKLTSYHYFEQPFASGNSVINRPVHFVCYNKTLYICIGWHLLNYTRI